MNDKQQQIKQLVTKIVQAAKGRGYTQRQLEDKCHLATGRLSKWVGGQGEPSAYEVWTIARTLEMDVHYFLDPEEDSLSLPGLDEFDLVIRMARRLGREEAERRLMLDDRRD